VTKHLQVVILAAGYSRRFPANKLLQPLPDHGCLLDRAVQLGINLSPRVLLVINKDEAMRAHCEHKGYSYVVNDQADTGMASSIGCGVSASADADGWAILLADMPCIRSATLATLARQWPQHEITVPAYRGRNGHPVIFSRSCASALVALRGDRGARALLEQNPAVYTLDTDDAGICRDIDCEQDWQAYLQSGCS